MSLFLFIFFTVFNVGLIDKYSAGALVRAITKLIFLQTVSGIGNRGLNVKQNLKEYQNMRSIPRAVVELLDRLSDYAQTGVDHVNYVYYNPIYPTRRGYQFVRIQSDDPTVVATTFSAISIGVVFTQVRRNDPDSVWWSDIDFLMKLAVKSVAVPMGYIISKIGQLTERISSEWFDMNRFPETVDIQEHNSINLSDPLNWMFFTSIKDFGDIRYNFVESHVYLQKLLYWSDLFIMKYNLKMELITMLGRYVSNGGEDFYSKSKIIPSLREYFVERCDLIVKFIDLYKLRHEYTRSLDLMGLLQYIDIRPYNIRRIIIGDIFDDPAKFGFLMNYYYGVPLLDEFAKFQTYDGIPDGAQIVNLTSPDMFYEMGTAEFQNRLRLGVLGGLYFRINLPTKLEVKVVDKIPDSEERPLDITKRYEFTPDFKFGKLVKNIVRLDTSEVGWAYLPENFNKMFTPELGRFKTRDYDDSFYAMNQTLVRMTVLRMEPEFIEDAILDSIQEVGETEHIVFMIE